MQAPSPSKFIVRFFFIFFPIIVHTAEIKAQGNLLVNPKRVVFEGKNRVISLNLANTGTDTASYNISLVQYRMKENGSFEEISQPDSLQRFADKFLRIFPRTVTLGPNEAQVVKVQLTRTNLLLPGEYRSHLYFRAVHAEKPLGQIFKDTSKNISISLNPVFGISIPVIIRSGETLTKADITNIQYQMEGGDTPQLKMQINRDGNFSIYGDLTITHVSPQGKNTLIGIAKGISIYTPNSKRLFVINLNKGVNYHAGKIKVEYAAQPDAKPETFAKVYLNLN
ncbi:MAG: molecular chaperone [Flavobacterium sp.]|nr:molecular chaperone [Pedobacter sp.]